MIIIFMPNRKLMDNINAAKKNWEFMLQQQIERIRVRHFLCNEA